jgi:D-sedoheptulose 7-phosphate isomerase
MSLNHRAQHISDYLQTLQNVLNELSSQQIEEVLEVFEQAYLQDRTIYICGNGGSWATAGHWVCDYAKGTACAGARRLRMISLGDNVPLLTALGNDISYDSVFSEPVRTYVRKDDVVILITASGNSPNILEAAKAAREMGAVTVGLIGFGGGKLAGMVDHQITVSCKEYGPVEDLHMILDHITSMYMRKFIAQTVK